MSKLLAVDEKNESSWRRLKDDYDGMSKSLMHITRAIDVIRNQLTVKLHDANGPAGVNELLDGFLEPVSSFAC